MAYKQLSTSTAHLPTDVLDAVALDAARDADRVGLFLETLGFVGSPENPLRIPAGLLLHLGVALRLLDWESQGIDDHQEAGLPQAQQALLDAFNYSNGPQGNPTDLCVRVVRLTVERFAWHGWRDLGADVALDDLDDDAALDALAEFLWVHRHAGIVPHHPQS